MATATYSGISYDISSQIPSTAAWGLDFSPDGTKMYMTGINTDAAYQYSTNI